MEQMDNKETTSSRLKILDAEYEIPSASKLERQRNPFRCAEHVMPKHEHEKLYDSKDCQDRCDQVATRGMDFPDMTTCRSALIRSRLCQAIKTPGNSNP